MLAKSGFVSLRDLADMKSGHRAQDEQRIEAGASREQIARENAFIDASVARRARIKSIGSRFPAAAFGIG